MATLEVKDLCKVFASPEGQFTAIEELSLTIEPGSFTTIVGPSGCGKSTLLNVLVGTEEPTSGSVAIHTHNGEPARLGYVFQSPRLLPWLTIQQNIQFVHPRAAGRVDAARYLHMVKLNGVELKYPYQLSGGMQQRAGIARALSIQPHVLLMDEPFSHLDAITAAKLRGEVVQLWQETRHTVLFVTHDLAEAVTLSDRIILMTFGGRIVSDTRVDLPRPRDMRDPEVIRQLAVLNQQFEGAA